MLDELDPEEDSAIDLELFIEEIQSLADDNEAPEVTPEPEETAQDLVGQRLTIDGRDFEIDSVNEDFDKVSLRDITSFQNN